MPIPIRMQIVKDSADNAELMPGNLLSHGFTPVELTARIKAMLPESNVILVFQHSASIYVCAEVAGAVVEAMRGKPPLTGGTGVKLGQREREVLALLAEGKSSPEIAARMHIAASTVEVHRRNIKSKLDLHSIAELTKYAIREGLTQP